MVEPWVRWWRSLAVREQRWLMVGAWAVGMALLYALAVEPAWRGRRAALAQLPGLHADVARMDALADEARRLSRMAGQPPEAALRVRTQLEASLAAAGLTAHLTQLTLSGELIDLHMSQVPAGPWLAWLDQALRETRWRVLHAKVEREVQPGQVNVRLTLVGATKS